MVGSFAVAAAQAGQRWTYLVQIESLGDFTGLHTWSVGLPDFASVLSRYNRRDTIAKLPGPPTAEKAPFLGGMTESGAVTIELVDYDDLITAALRIDRPPVTSLAEPIAASALIIYVRDGSGLPTSDFVLHVDSEAIAIASRSGNTLTVAPGGRGWLATDERSHPDEAPAYQSSPMLRTRRMHVYLAPTDADSEIVAREYEVGTYRLDRYGLGEGLGTWVLSGATEIKDLARLVCGRLPGALRVDAVNGANQVQWTPVPGTRGALDVTQLHYALHVWADSLSYFRVGDAGGEVVSSLVSAGSNYLARITERGQGNTDIGEIRPGDVLRPVLLGSDSFRYSPLPTPSTSRASGTWRRSAHPVDQLLCTLTSSAHPDDGLELVNFNPAYGNWSSLPVGLGIGYPAARINWGSFLAVRARTGQIRFPSLVFGETTETFAEWATRNFLEPLGWYLVIAGGLLTLVAPRLLTEDEPVDASIGPDDILDIREATAATELVAGTIIYRYRGPGGYEHTTTVKASDFLSLYASRAQYTLEDETLEMEIPGVRADQGGLVAFLLSIAQRRLFRSMRPPWRLRLEVGVEFHGLRQGDVVALSHPDLPDLNLGVRGWTNVRTQVTDAGPVYLSDDGGVRREIELLAFPAISIRRIAGSAMVTGVSGAGPWTCTVAANRYTAADAGVIGLPDTDADTFRDGYRVKTVGRNGEDRTAGHEVRSIGSNLVEIANGSGPPNIGDVITFDSYAVASTDQRSRFAAWAGDSNEIAPGVPAVRWGEG